MLSAAGAIAIQKCGVVPLFDQQRMSERQHQRGVGIRTDREPLGLEKPGCVRAAGADHHEFDAGGFGPAEP